MSPQAVSPPSYLTDPQVHLNDGLVGQLFAALKKKINTRRSPGHVERRGNGTTDI